MYFLTVIASTFLTLLISALCFMFVACLVSCVSIYVCKYFNFTCLLV
jgi:hypothetical protein